MKRVGQLGISVVPWRSMIRPIHAIRDANGDVVCETNIVSVEDTRLIAAAPELYACLFEAVVRECHGCVSNDNGRCLFEECFVNYWRKALEKAGGAE